VEVKIQKGDDEKHLLFVCYLCRWQINDNQLSRNFLLLLKINIIYSPRNKPGTLTPGKQLKDGDKGSIISIS